MQKETLILLGAGAVLGLLVIQATQKAGGAAGIGESVGSAAVDLVGGVASGAVFGIGNAVGLPDTRQPAVVSQGQAELDAGDYWNASFHLPAGQFISGTWNRLFN